MTLPRQQFWGMSKQTSPLLTTNSTYTNYRLPENEGGKYREGTVYFLTNAQMLLFSIQQKKKKKKHPRSSLSDTQCQVPEALV